MIDLVAIRSRASDRLGTRLQRTCPLVVKNVDGDPEYAYMYV